MAEVVLITYGDCMVTAKSANLEVRQGDPAKSISYNRGEDVDKDPVKALGKNRDVILAKAKEKKPLPDATEVGDEVGGGKPDKEGKDKGK